MTTTDKRPRTSRARAAAWSAVVSGAALLAGLLAVTTTGTSAAAVSPAAGPAFSFSTNPGLFPTFSKPVADYVIRCTGAPVQIAVTVPAGTQASINGVGGQTSSFNTTVPLSANQSFSVTLVHLDGSGSRSYFVRCLPSDFPNFSSSKPGTPQAEYYVVAPLYPGIIGGTSQVQYTVLFDTDGVPVWWMPSNKKYIFGTLLADKDIANVDLNPAVAPEFHLTGPLARTIAVQNGIDEHEIILLANGNYLLASGTPKPANEAFLGCGAPTTTTVNDQIVKEVAPDGTLVWSWDPNTHIPVSDMDPEFDSSVCAGGTQGGAGYDNYHFNSAEDNGTQVLISYRNLDAIYLVDKATGNIVWKLGGNTKPQSLTFVGDADGNFGGQHDARFFTDGTVTLHDDGTGRSRSPRAVRYLINTTTKTATLEEQITDPLVTSSICCGGARKLPAGDWVVSWGFSNVVTEFSPANVRQFLIQWDSGWFSYRVIPVLPGVLARSALRSDMNSQFGP